MPRDQDAIIDELLVMQSQDGDAVSMARLVRRWHPRLLRHAGRLTGRPDAAADVVQDSWLAIVRGLRRLDDPARFGPWAYRIVTNKCADWTRAVQRQRRVHRTAAEESVNRTRQTHDFRDDDEQSRLHVALERLSPDRRALLSMLYVDGMSVGDIARALGLARGTVKSRLFHAREKLRQAFQHSATADESEDDHE